MNVVELVPNLSDLHTAQCSDGSVVVILLWLCQQVSHFYLDLDQKSQASFFLTNF